MLAAKRDQLEKVFLGEVGVRESGGDNAGVRVEEYQKSAGLGRGQPWCAAFVAWCLDQAGVHQHPRSGWSPDWFRARLVYQRLTMPKGSPKKGDVFGIYFSSLGRVAHVGFVQKWNEDWVLTVEGNSNDNGSRNGDGVYRKRRLKSQIHCVSEWVGDRPAGQ